MNWPQLSLEEDFLQQKIRQRYCLHFRSLCCVLGQYSLRVFLVHPGVKMVNYQRTVMEAWQKMLVKEGGGGEGRGGYSAVD